MVLIAVAVASANDAGFMQAIVEAQGEVTRNVAEIRNASLKYNAETNTYLAAGGAVRAYGELTPTPHPWVGGERWNKLGWKPAGKLRSAYWVTTSGMDFTVHGVIDADGDGCAFEVVASATTEPTPVPGTLACW